jgi:hypothetical protein
MQGARLCHGRSRDPRGDDLAQSGWGGQGVDRSYRTVRDREGHDRDRPSADSDEECAFNRFYAPGVLAFR